MIKPHIGIIFVPFLKLLNIESSIFHSKPRSLCESWCDGSDKEGHLRSFDMVLDGLKSEMKSEGT